MLELRRSERLLLSDTGDWAKKSDGLGARLPARFLLEQLRGLEAGQRIYFKIRIRDSAGEYRTLFFFQIKHAFLGVDIHAEVAQKIQP